jgi:transcriptional regulator
MAKKTDRLNVIRGTLDIFVLQAVADRPLHGFEISLWLDEHSKGLLDVDDSALYQALHRLEARGFLEGQWGVSENNRRARFYQLTRDGRARLQEESERLRSYAQTIRLLLAGSEPRSL